MIDTISGNSSAPSITVSDGVVYPSFFPRNTLVRVTLKEECLVNKIELAIDPLSYLEFPPTEVKRNWRRFHALAFSYKIYGSKNGNDWIEIFDYSDYQCRSVQKLHFPALVFR